MIVCPYTNHSELPHCFGCFGEGFAGLTALTFLCFTWIVVHSFSDTSLQTNATHKHAPLAQQSERQTDTNCRLALSICSTTFALGRFFRIDTTRRVEKLHQADDNGCKPVVPNLCCSKSICQRTAAPNSILQLSFSV